ncbi:4'-phosphopantetheinyl transferase superfamily protein [Vibrio cholerae]|nr:4'-phosphopantetheinyl transferase superfamily protein [Vibrio cholerae]ELY5193020.1 4'-phosphopantetheinyl transferase superfamily protein [Vibrio cholerae]
MCRKLVKETDRQLPVTPTFLHVNCYKEISEGVFFCRCQFDATKINLDFAEKENIDIPSSIWRSVKKRQSEFIAGRYMAKLCLESLSIFDYDVAIGSNREPVWPEEIQGSISHTASQAGAIVTKLKKYRFVGLDIEELCSPHIAKQVRWDIHNKQEFALFFKLGFSTEMITTIIFSAKESLFKATFPYIRQYFGFECARVIDVSTFQQSLTLKLDVSHLHDDSIQDTFTCRYFIGTSSVTTIILE